MYRKGLDQSEAELRERIERYLEGRATDQDAWFVERWAAADPANAELLERIVRARRVAAAAPELWDADEAWARVSARLDGGEPARVIALRPRRRTVGEPVRGFAGRPRFLGTAVRAAAAVVALVGGVALWQHRGELFTRPVEMREFAAASGERVTLRLPDGSEIVLGSASRVWVPERFRKERAVRLEGEAVFDVAPDPDRPFVVTTDRARTRVLGTRFGVSAFSEDGYVDVVVAEGRVAVLPVKDSTAQATGAQVTAGRGVRVAADGTLGEVRSVDAEGLLSWTKGGLAFDQAQLAEVARTLDRRFGVRIAFANDALADLRLTADFGNAVDAAEIVRLIALSLGLEARQTSNGFLLHPVTAAIPARGEERN